MVSQKTIRKLKQLAILNYAITIWVVGNKTKMVSKKSPHLPLFWLLMQPNNTAQPYGPIIADYLQLIQDIEQELQRVASLFPKDLLQCSPGCSSCCTEFSVSPLEAAIIVENLHIAVAGKTSPPSCAFLKDKRCTIYRIRPILCRTQGMPIGYIDTASSCIEVSACPLNFADDYPLTENELFLMDGFNSRLADLNHRYCKAAGLDMHARVALATLL